jgi:hypothetical protein
MCLHLSTQNTWSQLYACLSSIVCPFCISSHRQLGQETRDSRKLSRIVHDSYMGVGTSDNRNNVCSNIKGI